MKPNENKKDSLFRLIQSMHKGEKRSFAMYCSHNAGAGEKIYLQLFKLIDKQKVYDEDVLKKKLQGKLDMGHLPALKNYLTNLILDSLNFYKNRNSKNLRIKLLRAEAYFDRGLYDLAEQALQKLRKEAELQEDFIAMFEILRIEKRLMLVQAHVPEDKLRSILEKEKLCFDSHREICDYTNLSLDVGQVHFKYLHSGLNEKEIAGRKIDKRPIFNGVPAPQTTYANYLLYNARGTYYRTLNDREQASLECAKALSVIEHNEPFRESHIETTFGALINYVTSLFILGDYKKARTTMIGLTDFIEKNAYKFPETLLLKYYTMQQVASLLMGEKKEAVRFLENVERFITTHNNISDIDWVTFYFHSVNTYQVSGDYSKAMYWLNEALNYKGVENINISLYYYLRILEIVILFEMKDYDLMAYRLRSLYRYQAKQVNLSRYEKVLMDFFRQVLRGAGMNNKALIQLFASLKVLLVEVFKDKNEAVALEYFNILNWIDSKIKK